MRINTIFAIFLLISIVLLAGCETQSSSPAPSGPVGGGCGFAAPAEDSDNGACSSTSSAENVKNHPSQIDGMLGA